jgi:hypothetical protein
MHPFLNGFHSFWRTGNNNTTYRANNAASSGVPGTQGFITAQGTEAGEKPIPESLGLACGVVFLVCIVLFQQLHYYNVASLVHHFLHYEKGKV